MGYIRAALKAYTRDDIWKAINAWKDNQFPSLIAATAHFGVPYNTARDPWLDAKQKLKPTRQPNCFQTQKKRHYYDGFHDLQVLASQQHLR
jgi:hypothetical protein